MSRPVTRRILAVVSAITFALAVTVLVSRLDQPFGRLVAATRTCPRGGPVPEARMLRVDPPSNRPMRIAVLDSYTKAGWRLPQGTNRFQKPPQAEGALRFEFTLVSDCGGPVLPAPDDLRSVELGDSQQVLYSLRQQTVRLDGVIPGAGTAYAVMVGGPVTTFDVASMPSFTKTDDAEPGPRAKVALRAADQARLRDRWIALRRVFESARISRSVARPVDVSSAVVEKVLAGRRVTAFEYLGAKALLARWAGIPARLGYGYWRPKPSRVFELRDRHLWVELPDREGVWRPMVEDGVYRSY